MAETSRRNHATRLAQSAARSGTDVVVVLGGDGTLNEAANGMVGTDTALAALPGGSTNVFARTIGLPDDPIEATGGLLDALAAGSIERIGLGSVNGRRFLFHVGIGFDAAVVRQVERRSALKRWASHALFVAATLDTAFRHFDRDHPQLIVEHADGTVVDDGYVTVVFNSTPYTYLGTRPIHVAPDAGLDRPLVVVTMRSLSFGRTVRLLVGAAAGRPAFRHDPTVDYRTEVHEVVVRGRVPVPYQVDGDHLGEATELRFRHEPDSLRLVRPRT